MELDRKTVAGLVVCTVSCVAFEGAIWWHPERWHTHEDHTVIFYPNLPVAPYTAATVVGTMSTTWFKP
jgi:hypothetical protein